MNNGSSMRRPGRDPAKTLAELQTAPKSHSLGYDRHHIVGQNPTNVEKRSLTALAKFGRATLDDDSNQVWVPRQRHWEINAVSESVDWEDLAGRKRRQVVSDWDFGAQRAEGLRILQRLGVLK